MDHHRVVTVGVSLTGLMTLSLCAAPQAAADEYARVAPVLPTAQVSASTSGTASLKASADIVVGFSGSDLSITPTVLTTTQNGIGTLFSLSADNVNASTPWQVGLGVAISVIGDQTTLPIETDDRSMIYAAKRIAYNLCAPVCAATPIGRTAQDQAFCNSYFPPPLLPGSPPPEKPPEPEQLSTGKFCMAGINYLKAVVEKPLDEKYDRKRRDAIGEYPRLDLSVGYALGSNQFKYLDTTGPMLVDTSKDHTNMTAAFSLTYVEQADINRFTFEAPVVLSQAYTAKSTTAQWCTVAGNVATAPAQTCTTRPLGAPDNKATITGSALFGVVSSPKAMWRASIGPVGSYTDSNSFYAGIQAPLYLSFVNVTSSDYVGDYKGVLRLTPRLDIAKSGSHTGPEALLLVEVLGKRSLFLRALDWL